MGYWHDKYSQKTTLQGTDELLIQDSDNNTTTVDDIKTYVENNSSVINSLTNNILIVKTYTDGGIIYIDKLNKILHANLFLAGNTPYGGFTVATITGFTPPSSNRDISFPVVYFDGTVGYGLLRVETTGAIKVYAHKTGTMVNVSVTGECYIG